MFKIFEPLEYKYDTNMFALVTRILRIGYSKHNMIYHNLGFCISNFVCFSVFWTRMMQLAIDLVVVFFITTGLHLLTAVKLQYLSLL
ncbi:hypothetical protein ACJX0J_042153, partial [Zea mays]